MANAKELIETRLKELQEKSKDLATKRSMLMKALDDNTFELMKVGGAIEELKKLVDNKEGEKK